MDQYIILRDLQGAPGVDHNPPQVRGTDATEAAMAIREPDIQIAELGRRGGDDLLSDNQVVARAVTMPLQLIKPVDMSPLGDAAEVADQDTVAWGVSAVGAERSSFTGAGTVVAVLDTGIDREHPAFAGIDILERDFTGTGNGDPNGHGTHCAATIAGRDVEGRRIGVASGIEKLLIGKVLDNEGLGSSHMLVDGINWATRHGADVISMSVGFDFPGQVTARINSGWPPEVAVSRALEDYRENIRLFDSLITMIRRTVHQPSGVVVVAAAGNESDRLRHSDFVIATSLPAAAKDVISVGALTRNAGKFTVAYFSNTFPQACAPGVEIISARTGGGLSIKTGTSMACPHMAGVAALWWEALRAKGHTAHSSLVSHKLLANTETERLIGTIGEADYGYGLAMAP
ncbi:S8 family peptidase [Nocardia sp. NPDC004340]